MIARITLILAMLLSTVHLPFCCCHAANATDSPVPSSGVRGCSNCCEPESQTPSCPTRPHCDCRTGRMLVLADLQDSEVPRGSRPTNVEILNADHESLAVASRRIDVPLIVAMCPATDSGGRAHLLRTHRLLI